MMEGIFSFLTKVVALLLMAPTIALAMATTNVLFCYDVVPNISLHLNLQTAYLYLVTK